MASLAGPSIAAHRLDATDPEGIIRMAAQAGPVDVLFNCAGFVHQGTILDATEAEWDFAFTLNVRSMFRTIRAFLPAMVDRGSGSNHQRCQRRQQHQRARPTASCMAPRRPR